MFALVLYILAFVALSGLMAAIEAALLSVTAGEIEELQGHRAWGAAALKSITQRKTRALVVIVVFTNTINILGPILAGHQAIEIYGDASIGIITAILTLGTIIFSEIIPKSLGSHHAPLLSRISAPTIRGLMVVLYPIVIGLEWFSNLFKTGKRRIGTEAQIRTLVSLGHRAGYIESEEGLLIRRAFTLNDKTAADIMTPMKDVICVAETASVRQAADKVFRHAYSRYPVFGESIHDVRGLVLSRDILEALTEGRDNQPIEEISRRCLYVPASMRSDSLLARFRDERIHLAVVRKNGQTVGLVTLEDVLEELVGEIEDEKDAG